MRYTNLTTGMPPIHPEYVKRHQRMYFIGLGAILCGIAGMVLPIIPGTVFFLAGASLLSANSLFIKEQLARLRSRYAILNEPIDALERRLFSFFDLTTHTSEHVIVPASHGSLSVLLEVSRIDVGVAVLLSSASGVPESPCMETFAEGMRARGLTVIRFMPRHGIGGTEDAFKDFTATALLEDLTAVLVWARTQPWMRGPLILGGHSIGGTVAAWYASQHATGVQGLILLNPTVSGASYEHALRTHEPEALAAWQRDGLRTMLHPQSGDPYALSYHFVEDAQKYDLTECAPRLTMPTLIVTSGADTVAPLEDCRTLACAIDPSPTLIIRDTLPHTPVSHRDLTTLRSILLA